MSHRHLPTGASLTHVVLVRPEIHWNRAGLDYRERYRDRFVGVPIVSSLVRSLNLSTSVGIAVYEVMRQRRAEFS